MFTFFGIEFIEVFNGHLAKPTFNELRKATALTADVKVSGIWWLSGYMRGVGVVERSFATWTVEFEGHLIYKSFEFLYCFLHVFGFEAVHNLRTEFFTQKVEPFTTDSVNFTIKHRCLFFCNVF
jgi:hypothetical protein